VVGVPKKKPGGMGGTEEKNREGGGGSTGKRGKLGGSVFGEG